MEHESSMPVAGTTDDYFVQKMSDSEHGAEFALEYLKSVILASAVNALFYARQQAGLTQAEVAERLHTTQSAIARLEGDLDGSLSLRRYVDYAVACGMLPHQITLATIDAFRDYVLHHPKEPLTQEALNAWMKRTNHLFR